MTLLDTKMLEFHQQLSGRTVFAGGACKWKGFLPNIRSSISRTKIALTDCAETGIKDVCTTAWGDNGAECALFSILLVLQAQDELGFMM